MSQDFTEKQLKDLQILKNRAKKERGNLKKKDQLLLVAKQIRYFKKNIEKKYGKDLKMIQEITDIIQDHVDLDYFAYQIESIAKTIKN